MIEHNKLGVQPPTGKEQDLLREIKADQAYNELVVGKARMPDDPDGVLYDPGKDARLVRNLILAQGF